MVTYAEHLKNILAQTAGSYAALRDMPEDLDRVRNEMLKINGFLRVMLRNIDDEKIQSSDYRALLPKFRHYLDSYSFGQEIDTMAELYSNDAGRIRNMRLKILEALEGRKMMEGIAELIRTL